MQETPKSAYIAFDRYPSAKGSATHMTALLETLSKNKGPTLLLSLPGITDMSNPLVIQRCFDYPEPNFLLRTERFRHFVYKQLSLEDQLQFIHFRDIWGGHPALAFRHARTLFEVNSLPSIELPYRYPGISASAKAKIRSMEKYCLKNCDAITVPSEVIRNFLVKNGVSASKITVITNGAHLPAKEVPSKKRQDLPQKYLIYFGALQTWQGINTLLKSFHYLRDLNDLHLVICSSQREKLVRQWHRLAERWVVSSQITWYYELEKEDLFGIIQGAVASVAPLADCDRNVEQGCSPLKIFESMACSVPVIASDLPVVREIMENGKEGLLVPADRPAFLARAIRRLWEDEDLAGYMGKNGQNTLKGRFLWEEKMKEYERLVRGVEVKIEGIL